MYSEAGNSKTFLKLYMYKVVHDGHRLALLEFWCFQESQVKTTHSRHTDEP